ncbi:MAG: hypothetical protein L3J52_06710 [Proteobacteria bacterium]|nr:hypothetical protein [Pseudomonadota bacterium]
MTLPKKQQFEQCLNDSFHIKFDKNESYACHLKEVNSNTVTTHSEQFSVIFSCDEVTVFEQGVFTARHKKLGDFELFLVPVFGDENGVQYEAVFT